MARKVQGIVNYQGLYREQAQHGEDYIYCEQIAARSRDFGWEITPHIHPSLFQLFVIVKGSVTVQFSHQPVTMQAPCLVFVAPNHLHGFRFEEEIEGTILSFSESYVRHIGNYPAITGQLQETAIVSAAVFHDEIWQLYRLLETLYEEIFSSSGQREFALSTYISLVVLQLSRLVTLHNEQQNAGQRNLEVFRAFQAAIRATKDPFASMESYARELGVSATHLNRICRTVHNRSALQVVQDEMIRQAQVYLRHTTYTIAEIAYQLGYSDPAYFSRFFKKHTGETPGGFRQLGDVS